MRSIARLFLFVFVGLLLVWLFRGTLYRSIVTYKVVGVRAAIATLDTAFGTTMGRDEAISEALDATSTRLYFSMGHVSNDPAELMKGGPANCIGYSALCASLLVAQLERSGMDDRYTVEHVIGKLYIGRWSLHTMFHGPFWKDHDIVRITDRRNGQRVYVDPALFDAVGIGRVTGP
jgi:hypothetical protein